RLFFLEFWEMLKTVCKEIFMGIKILKTTIHSVQTAHALSQLYMGNAAHMTHMMATVVRRQRMRSLYIKKTRFGTWILGGAYFLHEKMLKAVCKEIFMGIKILKTTCEEIFIGIKILKIG
ncbi:MAG: hypothetical protein RL757_2940, partial [Bacteroidota bacterium]